MNRREFIGSVAGVAAASSIETAPLTVVTLRYYQQSIVRRHPEMTMCDVLDAMAYNGGMSWAVNPDIPDTVLFKKL